MSSSLPASPPQHTSQSPGPVHIAFENTFARLPERFYARVKPTPVRAARLIRLNVDLAIQLGLDPEALAGSEGLAMLAGNHVAAGSEPLAQAYAGHQFGHFVPQLGDGRANLLGEVRGRDGRLYDLQLKGAGRTPFSRGGDGRAAVGPVLREYLLSEAMAALGVPTTRALAAVATGDFVMRETALPGAVLTRVATSHLRVGTFQYFAARGDTEATRLLAHYAIERHYPEVALAARPFRALLEAAVNRQASLIARWMSLGFVHGVMNTDNCSVSGETIDYGPCAWMEAYDPGTVFSSIDRHGRYAYSNQPLAALWNLTRLGESLLPLLEEEAGSEQGGLAAGQEALAAFQPQYEQAWATGFRRKLGLRQDHDGDAALAEDLLERMAANQVDYTLFFRRLCAAAAAPSPRNNAGVRSLFADPEAYTAWATRWEQRLAQDGGFGAEERAASMREHNPAVIPRNHRVQEVIDAAVQHDDFHAFEELLQAATHPFEERESQSKYMQPAQPEERVLQTFCGT